ncbi:AI-2E family transporter [Paracoccus jiaweipingae]|uniref:AI-2E family transporter n=1 Tax=unclassified Paracoccus (in: a-proteobacteria) TaxID=2688777 RepID=UPI0037BCEB42
MPQPEPHTTLFPRVITDDDKPARFPTWAVVGIFLVLLFFFISDARDFLMPVTLAALLFFVFAPVRRFFERFGINAAISATLITGGMVATLGVLGYLLSGPAGDLIDDAPQLSTEIEAKFEKLRQNFRGLEEAAKKIDEISNGGDTPTPEAAPATAAPPAALPSGTVISEQADGRTAVQTATGGGSVAVSGLPGARQDIKVEVNANTGPSTMESVMNLGPAFFGQVLFTMLLLFFMLASGDLLYLKIVQSFDTLGEKKKAYAALREIESRLGSYLGTITIINAGLGIAIGTAMALWGMPGALLFGIAGFLLNYIPYLGLFAGVILSFLVALVQFDDLSTPLMVAGTYLALTSIEGQLITPYFVSRRLSMNTVVVFLTVALWAWLWSILGMVVAMPLLVVMRVMAEHIPGLEKFGNFLAGEDPPALDDEDEEQARDIVETAEAEPNHDKAVAAAQGVDGRYDGPRDPG